MEVVFCGFFLDFYFFLSIFYRFFISSILGCSTCLKVSTYFILIWRFYHFKRISAHAALCALLFFGKNCKIKMMVSSKSNLREAIPL